MANTLTLPRRVSNADLIRYNAKINPFQEEIRQSLTNGRCSTDINFNTVVKPNTCTEDEKVLKGSKRFNKYKRVNHDILLNTKKEACQNNNSTDERHSFNPSTDISRHNANNNNKNSTEIYNGDKEHLCDLDNNTNVKETNEIEENCPELNIPNTTENRGILCAILENLESDEHKSGDKSQSSSQYNRGRFDKCIDKTITSETNKYRKVQIGKFNKIVKCSDVTDSTKNSKIKKYASAIPQPKGNIKRSEGSSSSLDLERNTPICEKTDISSNKYGRIKISQNENKLLNKTEVQEIRPSNVISSKLCIPVHNRTGKKHGVGLNVIDTIAKTDKTITFNKGDVQNQRCGSINKYCRNICDNEPVLIKGRLSKTGRSRTTVVTIDKEGDLAHSCSADNVCLTLGNVESTSSNSNEEWKHNVEITRGDFNIERDTTCESTCKKDQLNRKLTLETKEGRDISLSLNHEISEVPKTNGTFRIQSSHNSPLSCQYQFNDFTCAKYILGNDQSSNTKSTNNIGYDKNESVTTSEGKHISQFKTNDKDDILTTNEECESLHNFKVNGTDVSSNFMKFQKTGSNGIMDNSLPTKYQKRSTLKHGAIKHSLKNDKVESKLIGKQVKQAGNVLNSTKTSIISQRLKSSSGRSDITPQGKVKSVIKREDQVRTISTRITHHDDVSKNIQNEKKNDSASGIKQPIKQNVLLKQKIPNRSLKKQTTETSKVTSKLKDSGKIKTSKVKEVELISRTNDNIVSRSKVINKVCQILPTGLIDCDNRQSSDNDITDGINETCATAKSTSIDNQVCSEDIKTFTENKSSNGDYVSPRLISASNVHDNKLIEELKQQNERGNANLRRKKCIGSDRLHNIKATGNNNSEDIDHLADGHDGNADDHKVHQTTGGKLSYLFDLNTKSEKDISNDHEVSSANITVCTSKQLQCNFQKHNLGKLSSAGENENDYCNKTCEILHNSSNCMEINGQYQDNHKCVNSSSVSEGHVPKAITNDNWMMGNDLQYMTSARNSCRGINCNIGDSGLHLDLNLHDLQSDSCNKDSNDSSNMDDFVNNGIINKSTTSTDGSNYDISLPLTVSTDNNLRHAVTDTLLCNINNTEVMEKQRADTEDIDIRSNNPDMLYETEPCEATVKEEPKVVNQKQTSTNMKKKLLSPKISSKKFNYTGNVNQPKTKTSVGCEKSEKERLNLENSKLHDKMPRTTGPCSNSKLAHVKSTVKTISASEPKSSHRIQNKEGNKPLLHKTATKTLKVDSFSIEIKERIKKELSPCSDISNSSSSKADSSSNEMKDRRKKEFSPCSDISNSSSSTSDKGVRSKTKPMSVIRRKVYDQPDKSKVKTSTRQKVKDTSDATVKIPGDRCQSRISTKSLSSAKITNTKYTPSSKQLKNTKSIECPSQEVSELIKNASNCETAVPVNESSPSPICTSTKLVNSNIENKEGKTSIPIKSTFNRNQSNFSSSNPSSVRRPLPSASKGLSNTEPTGTKSLQQSNNGNSDKLNKYSCKTKTTRVEPRKVTPVNKPLELNLNKRRQISQTPSPTLSRTSRSSSIVSPTTERQATFVVMKTSTTNSTNNGKKIPKQLGPSNPNLNSFSKGMKGKEPVSKCLSKGMKGKEPVSKCLSKGTDNKEQTAKGPTKESNSKGPISNRPLKGTRSKDPVDQGSKVVPLVAKTNIKKIVERHATPSPTLSRSSRASSVVSPPSVRKQTIAKPKTKNEKSTNISTTSRIQTPRTNISGSFNYRSMPTNSKSTCKTDTGKCNAVNTAVKNQKPNSFNLENVTNIPRTKISKTTTIALNKGTKLQKPKIILNSAKQRTCLENNMEDEKATNAKYTVNTEGQELSMKSFTENLICNKTSDINDEKLKTVCISDKPDHVSTADQIREKPFEFCEAQKTNIITNLHLQEQVQDPLIEIVSTPNCKTITPMDNIYIKSSTVHSSDESVCSEQYWSASEGENTPRVHTPEITDFGETDTCVDTYTETMEDMSILHGSDKNNQCDMFQNVNNNICKFADDNSCEKSHVQYEADDCSVNALQLGCETDSLDNFIDGQCTTKNISENSTFDLMIQNNISQQSKHDRDTSERLIHTMLMLDSRDIDKAQYVSTDYEENITPRSNLEHFNAGNDQLSVKINEDNHCKSESKYSTDITENAVKELYVKTEKISEKNIMEPLINRNLSSDLEHLQAEDGSTLLISLTEESSTILTSQIGQTTREGCADQKQTLQWNIDEVEYEIKSDDQLPSDECFKDVLEQEGNKGDDFAKFDETETYRVRTSPISGNGQFETYSYQNGEVLRSGDYLICEKNNTDSFDRKCRTDCIECSNNDSTDVTYNVTTSNNFTVHDNLQVEQSLSSEKESHNVSHTYLASKEVEWAENKDHGELKTEFDSYCDTESDYSDSSGMASSSVQNSPSARRPRRVFSKAERRQKYEQSSVKSRKNENEKHLNKTSTTNTDVSTTSCNENKTESIQSSNNDSYQRSSPQKSETEVHSIDNEGKNIHGICDNTSINSKSRCMQNSLINVNTVHIKHNMDDRSNKHSGQKINEEETLTKIITNQHDLKLSHSQSQELELILSDETLLSSAKHTEDLDAAQDVVQRVTRTSALPENRRAINLDKIFHSEEGSSIWNVECTLQLNSEENQTYNSDKDDSENVVDTQSFQVDESPVTTVTSTDVEVEETVCLTEEDGTNDKGTPVIADMDNSNNSQNVSTDHVSIQSSFDGWCYLSTDTQSDMNERDNDNDYVNTNTEYKPDTLNSRNKNPDELGESILNETVCNNEIKETENDTEQRLLNSNNCNNQLKCNIASDNSTHTLTDEQLKVSNSAFAEVHEKIVICTVNNTIPNTEHGDKSTSSDDGTSKNLDENNRSHADRKHLTLELSIDEKHNNEMGLTANAKVVKNKSRQHPRRLTDTIRYERDDEGDNGSLTPTLKQRARSKSPIGCILSPKMDNEPCFAGHGKVSEICRTFIRKTCNRIVPGSPAESGAMLSSQSPSMSRHMKWARVEGVWQRIPVDDDAVNMCDVIPLRNESQTSKPNRKSNETLSQWKHLVDKIQKTQKEKRDLEGEVEKPDDKQSVSLTPNVENVQNKITDNIRDTTEKCHNSSIKTTGKPKPPKTLPKPKRPNKTELTTGVNEVSIIRSISDNGSSHVSSQTDNEQGEMHKVADSNQRMEKNKSKQVQQSVEDNKEETETMCTNNSSSVNEHENSIKTCVEIEHKEETVKSAANSCDFTNVTLTNEKITMQKQMDTLDLHKGAHVRHETNDGNSLHFTREIKDNADSRTTRAKTPTNNTSLENTICNTNDKAIKDSLQNRVGSPINVQAIGGNDSAVNIRQPMTKQNTDTCNLFGEKDNKSMKKIANKGMTRSSDDIEHRENTKSKAVPIKQEMFPREEEDISSDIIAKVLKVMDSFTNQDTQYENSDVKFVIGSEELCDDGNSNNSKDNKKKDLYQQDNGTKQPCSMVYGQRQQKLLSEISELEERSNEDILEDKNKNITSRKGVTSPHCNTPPPVQNNNDRSRCLQESSFSRSHSLPTTAISHPGSRILYRDGSFVIEPDFPEEVEENVETRSLDFENGNIGNCNTMGQESNSNRNSFSKCKRSQSEADLCDVDSEEHLFLQNDGNLTVIENENYSKNTDVVLCRSELDLEEDSNTLPSSIEESELVGMGVDNKRRVKVKKKTRLSARRSRSFRDFSDTEKPIVSLRRNLSFVEALNDKEQLNDTNRNGSVQSLNSTISIEESPKYDQKMSLDDTRSKTQGFLQKVFSRRKGSIDQGGKKKGSESKESKLHKMSLKTFFSSKKGREQSVGKGLFKEPQTPPIAAFQSDNDIHIIDSAPGSPYSSSRFKRRHTSAEIYDQTMSTNSSSRSSLDISCHKSRPSRLEDQLSMRSFNSSTLSISEQPLRPKSPKPNVMIIRRNSNLSLPSSPVNEVVFDMGGKMLDVVTNRKYDSVDAGKLITQNTCNDSHPNNEVPTRRPSKQMSGVDLDKLASLVQIDMTSSNSNDSGIQHDVSVHSSSESLKTSADSSNVPRRRKSPSPRPERPKSEISVRWADLVESTEISPVKRREGGESRPRPKSDLEDNLQLFDEMYEEVFDDLVYFTGGSSLSPDMKPFGSQNSLQLMYSSLQSLDSIRKHDPVEQKPSKRRMSTPHPIKTRLSRVPPKQQKHTPLVRSHSMPESLDKLHRRRKFHSTIGSSNLHDFYLRHFDDDSSSDDSSDISVDHVSLNEKSLSAQSSRAQLSTLDEMPESENRTYAEALWDHITMDPEELRFRHGDLIEIIDMNDKDWWYGALDDHQEGWLPATFVRLRVNQENFEEDFISRFSEIPEHSSPNLRRISMINTDQGRTNVIKEILQAEQDYVKHMKDVVEGYIRHARKRVDMFTEEKISVIFGNIEEIFKFSTQFLETLETAYCKEQPHQSELGKCFLKYSKGFEIYSDYCNNHPSGSAELKDLYRKQKYRHFFEACRLLQEMIEIPLEGFLLNPVQKICKYPLQLAELLKYTPQTHPDYESVQQALEAMKKIAALINERKRKMESIEKLASWQLTVEDWQGKDLLEKSSELIYSSEINKINSAGWSQERWFYLFDHQLVYCKKDLLKRNGFSYKGRIDMDQCDVINIEDGKDVQYNVTVKNAWKLHETHKDKWYLLFAKTPAEKQRWIKAFQKERERVKEDQENNFMPDHWKRTILNRIKASQEKQKSRAVSDIQYKQEFIRGIPSHATLPRSYSKKQNKKKGWFPFGGKQKSKS